MNRQIETVVSPYALTQYIPVAKLRINEDGAYFRRCHLWIKEPKFTTPTEPIAWGGASSAVMIEAGMEARWYVAGGKKSECHIALVDESTERIIGRLTFTANGLLYLSHSSAYMSVDTRTIYDAYLAVQAETGEWSISMTDQTVCDTDILRYRATEGRMHLPDRYLGLRKRQDAISQIEARRQAGRRRTPAPKATPKQEEPAPKPKQTKAKPPKPTTSEPVKVSPYMFWPPTAHAMATPAPVYAPIPTYGQFGMPSPYYPWPWANQMSQPQVSHMFQPPTSQTSQTKTEPDEEEDDEEDASETDDDEQLENEHE